jgi:hypothetical protein
LRLYKHFDFRAITNPPAVPTLLAKLNLRIGHAALTSCSRMPPPTRAESGDAAADWWWVFDPRISLRARAVCVVGGGTLVMVILLAWIAAQLVTRHVQAHLAVPFEGIAYQVSERLDRQLYARFATLQLTASLSALRRADATANDRRLALENVLHTDGDFAWLGFVDASGHVVAATQAVFEGNDVSQAAWFVAGREKPYAARVHPIPELSRLGLDSDEVPRYIDFATPVTTAEGRFIGVLGAFVRMPTARDIQPSALAEVGRREHLGVTIYGPADELLLDTGASGWTDPPGAPSVRELRGSLVESTGNGFTYFTAYMRERGFREFPGLGWLVTVRQPVQDAFAPARRLQRDIVAWGVALTLALSALTWWYVGRFVKRMWIVENAAKLIRQGDVLTVLPHPKGEGEMDRMCAALDNLVEDLRAKHQKPAVQPPPSETRPW